MSKYPSDVEDIKTDMGYFLKELSKKGVIDITKTILLVIDG